MGDVHIEPPAPNKVGAKVAELIESGHAFYASAVTGTPTGRTRRPTLFLAALIGVAIGFVEPAALIVAMIAILLLAYTDAVVPLE